MIPKRDRDLVLGLADGLHLEVELERYIDRSTHVSPPRLVAVPGCSPELVNAACNVALCIPHQV